MPLAVQFYDVVVSIHVMAVIAAFGGWFVYPLLTPTGDAAAHRAHIRAARFVVNPAGTVVLAAGIYLATDRHYWSKIWVSVPLVILVVVLGITGSYFIPRQKRLARLAEGGAGPEYAKLAGQVRLVMALAALLVLVAVFFMVVKP